MIFRHLAVVAASIFVLAASAYKHGNDVIVSYDGSKCTIGRVFLEADQKTVWRVVSDPYKFERGICRNLKKADVLECSPSTSLVSFTYGLIYPFPDQVVKVRSSYYPYERIEFHRDSGSLKELSGKWEFAPQGQGTELTYSLHVVPSVPVPEGFVRWLVRQQMPDMLRRLRQSVESEVSADRDEVQ